MFSRVFSNSKADAHGLNALYWDAVQEWYRADLKVESKLLSWKRWEASFVGIPVFIIHLQAQQIEKKQHSNLL